jgi:hypothetical protein
MQSTMLSPGISVTPLNGSFLAAHNKELGVASYRITEDTWGAWSSPSDGTFPQGVRRKLDTAPCFASLIGANGTYPDLDMLPLGRIFSASAAAGVVGPAVPTALTPAEQRTAVTLYSIVQSPMILGAQLPLAADDAVTLSLVTNAEILYLNGGRCRAPRPLPLPPPAPPDHYAWACAPASCPLGSRGGCAAVALFNAADDHSSVVSISVSDALWPAASSYYGTSTPPVQADPPAPPIPPHRLCVRDLWARAPRPLAASVAAGPTFGSQLQPHSADALLLWLADAGAECSSGEEVFQSPPRAAVAAGGCDSKAH